MKNLQIIIKQFLTQNGIKVRKLAEYIGITEAQANKFLNGRNNLTAEQQAQALRFMDGKWLTQVDITEMGVK